MAAGYSLVVNVTPPDHPPDVLTRHIDAIAISVLYMRRRRRYDASEGQFQKRTTISANKSYVTALDFSTDSLYVQVVIDRSIIEG